jgi:NAD(P)-dependent dehydrogenase (short-subunit alcohol dehydrogenase family)
MTSRCASGSFERAAPPTSVCKGQQTHKAIDSSSNPEDTMDVSLNLQDTHVLITGGGGLIGRVVVRAFLSAGALVSSLDKCYASSTVSENGKLVEIPADTTDEKAFASAWNQAVSHHGEREVETVVALAALDYSVLAHPGLIDMEVSQWLRTFEVNVGGTMMAAREWMRGLRNAKKEGKKLSSNVSCVLVGSESGWFGEVRNPDYSASKAAVQVGLLRSLRAEVGRLWEGARCVFFLFFLFFFFFFKKKKKF